MKDDLQFTRAGREDLFEIAVFLDDCWRVEYRGIVEDAYLDALSVAVRHRKLLARYEEGVSEFLMMVDAGGLVGVAGFGKSFTEGYEEDGEISAIYLRKDAIGKGYGSRLFAEAEQRLGEKGYSDFVLDVLTENERALKFYLAHGYNLVNDCVIRLGEREYPLSILRKTGIKG
jgi:ribosomal protein S18 acetylase RimI-like enzyme